MRRAVARLGPAESQAVHRGRAAAEVVQHLQEASRAQHQPEVTAVLQAVHLQPEVPVEASVWPRVRAAQPEAVPIACRPAAEASALPEAA